MIRAAFIGVDRYQDRAIPDLTGASRDARALAALFADSIDQLEPILLTDAAASKSAVDDMLDKLFDAAGPDDVVLLGFAGHGSNDHRLLFADTRTSDPATSSIAMAEIAGRFTRTKAKAVFFLLDCCFSGGAAARAFDLGLVARDIDDPLATITGKGRVILSASQTTERAYEDPTSRHGLLTKAVIDCLVNATGPLGILTLSETVIAQVRAEAARFGHEQNPALFGQIDGAFTLPPGKRGTHYFAAFPERRPLIATGPFADLAVCGIPDAALDAWQARYPTGLNALQRAAINDHHVLDGRSLLVVAPTSAGKTFVGEIAGLRAIAEGQKAIFLLPYKALVNEKFEDFSALYGEQLGLRVVRCSGDWQDQVGDVLGGKYDIAFFTYEKFLSLSLGSPHILNQLGLVVLDEAQFITDAGRGIVVELLLTSLVSARKRGVAPQLVALSAVIGDTNHLENWLDSDLLMTTDRPVPLREGVLDRSGSYLFADPASAPAREPLLDRWAVQQRGKKASSQDVIVPLVRHLVAQGEKIIIFRNRRGPSAGCAEYLAAELNLPPAKAALDALPDGDRSDTSERLRRSLAGGVAFHSSDLDRDERLTVEHAFRKSDGEVSVLVATSTVAAGINTPASTVIIVESSFAGPEAKPYSVAQYKNMAGRAGRLGYEAQGKAIILADTPFEQNRLFHHYVEGKPEAIGSSFAPRDPGTWVIRLLAQVREVPRDAVADLLTNTYGGYLATMRDAGWVDAMRPRIAELVAQMLADGLLEEEAGYLRLTMLGRACGESPLSLRSAIRAVELIRRCPADQITPETLLVLVEALPERDDDYVPQPKNGEPGRQREAQQRFGYDIARQLGHRAESDKALYGRCKRALIVRDWIEGVPVSQIEQSYTVNAFVRLGHGDIRGYADGSRFLLDSVARLAAILLERADPPEALTAVLKRLEMGLPDAALELTTLPIGLTRGEILALTGAGILSADAILAAPREQLDMLLSNRAGPLLGALAET